MILLTMKEEKRLIVVQKVMDGAMELGEGANVLGVSERQMYRLMASVRKRGPSGLIHGNRGCDPCEENQHTRKYDRALQENVLRCVKGKYADVNDTHLSELLKEREGIEIGQESLRRLLRGAGITPKKKRRGKVYRHRRDRKAAFGAMIQLDTSLHAWLEGQAPFALTGGIDDATNKVWAQFEVSECTFGVYWGIPSIDSKYRHVGRHSA
jgi:transposase